MKVIEGYMPYLGYQTYYRIVGECKGNKKPLVLLQVLWSRCPEPFNLSNTSVEGVIKVIVGLVLHKP